MLKQILVGGSILAGLTMSIPAFAQSSAPAPASPAPAPARPAPEASPAPTSPAPTNTEVSDAEIEKFASAIKQFRTIQEGAQQQAAQIVEGEELSWERFNQILQTQRDPQSQPSPEVTSEERQQFDRAVSKLEELQQTTRTQMDQALQTEGIPRDRFAEILAMVRQDAGLRQRIEQRLQN